MTTLLENKATIDKLASASHDIGAIQYGRRLVVVRKSDKRELSPILGARDMGLWIAGYLAGYGAGLTEGVREGRSYEQAYKQGARDERNRLGLPGESWTSEAYAQMKEGNK